MQVIYTLDMIVLEHSLEMYVYTPNFNSVCKRSNM